MMYSGKIKTRAQSVALVWDSGDSDIGSQIPTSPILHEPNKAAVKLSFQPTRQVKVSSPKQNLTRQKSGTGTKVIHANKATANSQLKSGSNSETSFRNRESEVVSESSEPEFRYSSPEPLETPQSETKEFYSSQLSLEWPADQSPLEERSELLVKNLTFSSNGANISNPATPYKYGDQQQLSPPPPLPKLRPINVVDPVLNQRFEVQPQKPNADTIDIISNAQPSDEDRIKQELDQLKKELDSQIQINAELKKMLVASMGDDLQYRLERLVRDKAQLSQEVGHFSRRVTEDYEELDKISIQADMWHSKYKASRVMVEELTNLKTQLQRRYQQSETALVQLIEERHELNRVVAETYGYLKHVRDAFEPATAATPLNTVTCNTLMLADMCKSQAQSIHLRLLPGGKPSLPHVGRLVKCEPTQGETMATEIITHGESQVLSQGLHPPIGNMSVPRVDSIPRFHPLTRYENFTIAGCSNCHGEIIAV